MYLTIYLVQTEWTALRSVRPSTQLVMFQLQIQLKVRPRYKTNFISISQQQIMQPPLSISNNTKEMSKVNLLQYWDIKEVITLFLRINLNVFTKACARAILSCLCFIHKKHDFFSLSYQHSLHGGPSLNFDVSIIFCSLDDNTLMIYFYFPFSSLLGHIIYSNTTMRLHSVS